MITSVNMERNRRTTLRISESGHPTTRRNSKRDTNSAVRVAVRQALRDPRTW